MDLIKHKLLFVSSSLIVGALAGARRSKKHPSQAWRLEEPNKNRLVCWLLSAGNYK